MSQERTGALLHSKVEVQADLLSPGQQAFTVGEGPARLYEGNVVVPDHVDDSLVQEVYWRLKVGIEDGYKLKALVLNTLHAVNHGSSLVPAAIVTAHQLHIVALFQTADHSSIHLLPH